MNAKAVVPLVVALGLGVVAAKMGKDMMARGRQGGDTKLIKLVVAREDLAPGSTIKEADVAVRELPVASASPETFVNPSDLVGRVVTGQLTKGQLVTSGLLARKGELGGAQAMVPEGMRAVTLEVNEYSGVGGLLTPGSHVDVVQTIRGKLDDSGTLARTIVSNLKVIAVGRKMSTTPGANGEADGAIAKSVTLLATPEEAEAIDLAAHVGNPRLVLRNGSDVTVGDSKGVSVAELRGGEAGDETPQVAPVAEQPVKPVETAKVEATKPAAPAVNYRDVEVIRGGASTSVRLTVGGGEAVTGVQEDLEATPEE
jgi:pilus assembly protein CpaB